MTDKEIVERAKEAEKRTGFGELVHSPISKGVNSAFGIGFIEGMVEYRNSLQEEPTTSVWHSAKDEEPTKGKKIVVLTSVCNIADKNLSFMGEYISNRYVQAFNAKEYMNSWAKWAYMDDLLKL